MKHLDLRLKFLFLLIPIFISVLFVRNVIFVEKYSMDTWLGGGMRMFSKIDHANIRVVGFYTQVNDSVHFVNISNNKQLYDKSLELRVLPKDIRFKSFLKDIKSEKWYYDTSVGVTSIPVNEKSIILKELVVDSIKVFAYNYSIDSKKVNLNEIASYKP